MKKTINAVSAAALLAAIGLAVHVSADDAEQCEGANCPDTRITNLHHQCDNPGGDCGSEEGCVCRDVNGGIWSDCYCLKADVTRQCTNSCSGGWVVKNTKSVAFEPGAVVEFAFVRSSNNFLMSFDFADVAEDGTLERYDVLRDDPGAIRGGFTIEIGERFGVTAPATFSAASFRVDCPLPIFESQSFDNVVRSDGRNTEVTGYYNFDANEFVWDNALTLYVESSLFDRGVDLKVKPTLTPTGRDGYFNLHISSYVTRPDYLRCGVADMAAPIGVMDFEDLNMFLHAYSNQQKAADIAEPFGVIDEIDMGTFIKDFTEGCPHDAAP